MKTGIELIAEERQRQIEVEGFTAIRDTLYANEELAKAAVSYALPKQYKLINRYGQMLPIIPEYWPWHHSWWKPSPNDRVRELVKAGALIAAEIDRLQAKTQ